MDWQNRIPFFCGACLGLAVGFATGHVTFWQPETRQSPSLQGMFAETPVVLGGVDGLESLPEMLTESPSIEGTPVPGGAVVLNEPDHGEDPVHADAIVALPAEQPQAARSPVFVDSPPSHLRVAGARPITALERVSDEQPAVGEPVPATLPEESAPAKATLDPVVVELLGDELKDVTEQQREIWADALQGLPPGDAAGIIRMWKNFGDSSAHPMGAMSPPFPGLGPRGSTAPPAVTRELPPPRPLPPVLPPASTTDDPRLAQSESWMRQIVRHNTANVETCGYLNMVPLRQELPFDPLSEVSSVIIGYRLDVMPGRYVRTRNPSHVATQRQTFFAVRDPAGRDLYTRVGRLSLDAERRVCIDLGTEDLPLVPELKLPETVTRFSLLGDTIQVLEPGQSEPRSIGQLQVAEFFDATRLEPQGRSLYAATAASGLARMVPAELMQETLEYPPRVDELGQRMTHR
ncbi:MAG: hypothetical protein DWH91_14645 [Planctomycetota bacterium]|nr:MAG: hypothetical protein DWH91_14645 [Planctomycetota bacterium]